MTAPSSLPTPSDSGFHHGLIGADVMPAHERTRLLGVQRLLVSLPSYVAALGMMGAGVVLGVVDGSMALFVGGLAVMALLAFHALLVSGVAVRSRDPLLAYSQVLFNLTFISVGYTLLDGLRSTALLWLSVVIVFDMRRLPLRQMVGATLYAMLLLVAATLIRAWVNPQGFNWVHEQYTLLILVVVVPAVITVSGKARGVRERRAKQKEQLALTLGELRRLAVRDSLTGLYNRRHMMTLLEEEARRTQRTRQPCALAMLDLDHFKQVNDQFGHGVGDAVLKAFATLSQSAFPDLADALARWGGEEFLLLQPEMEQAHMLRALDQLRVQVHRHDWAQYAPGLSVTFSGGIAEHHAGQTIEQTLDEADKALYRAKAQGRDRIACANERQGAPAAQSKPTVVKGQARATGTPTYHLAPTTQTPRHPDAPPRLWQAGIGALLALLLGSQARLRGHLIMCLVAASVYATSITGLLLYSIPAGLMSTPHGMLLVGHNLIGAIVPPLVVRLGLTARLQDPSFVLVQLIWAGIGLSTGYGLMPSTGPSTLQMMCLCVVFGFSTLRPVEARLVGLSYMGMLLGVLAIRTGMVPANFNLRQEILDVAMTCLVLWVLTVQSQNFGRVREQVRHEKKKLTAATEQLHQLMMHDALTGLPNRRQLQHMLERECDRHLRSGSGFGVALIDLDHFKRINDGHGHQVGDEALVGFARAAQDVLRETDVIGRWGGEEFLVLLPDTVPAVNALLALNRLRENIAARCLCKSATELQVTFSAGLAQHRAGEPISATLERADEALYAAKAAGRNRCISADAPAEPRPTLVRQATAG